jgi:hypothetical protein
VQRQPKEKRGLGAELPIRFQAPAPSYAIDAHFRSG